MLPTEHVGVANSGMRVDEDMTYEPESVERNHIVEIGKHHVPVVSTTRVREVGEDKSAPIPHLQLNGTT